MLCYTLILDKGNPKTRCKYVNQCDYGYRTNAFPNVNADKKYYEINDAQVVAKASYAWDGPSGPTIDTPSSMRASLIHDALYQAIRDGDLEKKDRKKADKIMLAILKRDGMKKWRRSLWYIAVRACGSLKQTRHNRANRKGVRY